MKQSTQIVADAIAYVQERAAIAEQQRIERERAEEAEKLLWFRAAIDNCSPAIPEAIRNIVAYDFNASFGQWLYGVVTLPECAPIGVLISSSHGGLHQCAISTLQVRYEISKYATVEHDGERWRPGWDSQHSERFADYREAIAYANARFPSPGPSRR